MLEKSTAITKPGDLLPTPDRPEQLPIVELTDNAHDVFIRRYARRDLTGAPIETVEDTFWRVAYHIAKAEDAGCEAFRPEFQKYSATLILL